MLNKSENQENYINILVQFVKFGIVGLSNTLISMGIYYIFVFINRKLYIIGNTVGFVVSVFNAYYWNNKYVFEKTDTGHMKPLIKTFVVYGTTFVISTALLFVMVSYLGISEYIAPAINLIITIPLNFVLNKVWAFK